MQRYGPWQCCRHANEYKNIKQQAKESKERADKDSKTVRQLNVTIGKLEQKLQSSRRAITPLGPRNGKPQEGWQFAAQHTALVKEMEELKEENAELKRLQGDEDVRMQQVGSERHLHTMTHLVALGIILNALKSIACIGAA
jgi:chromosome segregation ATPase